MIKKRNRAIMLSGILAAWLFICVPHADAQTSQVQYCTDDASSLTPIGSATLLLGSDWELTADNIGWCRKQNDPDVDNIVVARGNVKIGKKDNEPILGVDFSEMSIDDLSQVTVTVERDADNKVLVVAPSYSGLGMQLYASDIIKHGGSSTKTAITLISDFPWRFYPDAASSNLVLYPAFFRPILTGVSDGTFGFTANFADAIEYKFTEGSLNLPIPFNVTQNSVSTVVGQNPTVLINFGTWIGKVFGLPVGNVPVTLSQISGESTAEMKFSVGEALGSITGDFLGLFSHAATIQKVFKKVNSKDNLKLATKEAIVWGDAKIVKYSSSKLSPLLDDTRTGFLKDIEDAKANKGEDPQKLLKFLGRFIAMADNSEIDYDFISQDIQLNPLYIQLGLFEAMGDFQGSIYAGFAKRGDPAWYFIDTLGLDITMPYELTWASAAPFYALEKIPLPENPFQVGLGIVELGGKISGMADPLYDVFQLAGKGGQHVDYSKWHVDAETEGEVALVDSLQLISSTQSIGLPWPLSLKTTFDFKLGNQNGIAGTGNISFFDIIYGSGSFHFFIGDNAAPVDFQAGFNGNILGADLEGTFNGFINTQKTFWMKLNGEVAYRIAGHDLGSLPAEIDFSVNQNAATVGAGFSWGAHFCAFHHCLIHSGSKGISHSIDFHSLSETATEPEISYGDTIYTSDASASEHHITVESGNERLTVSAMGSPGTYPVFVVSGPGGTSYYMQETENDGGAPVIDVNSDATEVHPISEVSANSIEDDDGFLVDAETGTTLFVLEDPQPGEYVVSLAPDSVTGTSVAADVTAGMVTIGTANTAQQAIDINETEDNDFTVSVLSQNTHANATIGIYARPATFRNSIYDNWHERYFSATADASMRDFYTDSGDFDYRTDGTLNPDNTLGYLEATSHGFDSVVVPETDIIQLNPPATIEETIRRQRNITSIKIGEFSVNADGEHLLNIHLNARAISTGQYHLLARFESRKDAEYVELPYVMTVHGDALLPAPEITSVSETGSGEALIQWRSNVNAADIAKVRIFLHDEAMGGDDEVYHTSLDFDASEQLKIPGLKKGETYGFSIALLKTVTITDSNGKTRTLDHAGLRSQTVEFTPSGEDFVGAPSVKLVDHESYASFMPNGDLFVRLRVLNESGTDMSPAPVRIYLNHRTEGNLLAEFNMPLAGSSFSDIHITIPFERLSVIKNVENKIPSIVYDIDTSGQNEMLTYDNAGVLKIKNTADFFAAKDSNVNPPLLLNLKKGWNLVGDAVMEDDVFDKFTDSIPYAYDGGEMKANFRNPNRGSGYFIYLPRDMHILLTGTPYIPEFENLNTDKWQLLGTGVDIYNTFGGADFSPTAHTYTPGTACKSVYSMQRRSDGEPRWVKNPDIINAGSGFWCIKE